METNDEGRDDHRDDHRDDTGQAADVARYEQLRRRALDGDADGWRAGLAVLQTRGVAAWLRAWRDLGAAPHPPRLAASPAGPDAQPGVQPGTGDRLVAALASMALGALART